MYRVGIAGASGYTGAELLRLVHGHPAMEVAWATGDSQAGELIESLYPSLAAAYGGLTFDSLDGVDPSGVDLVFLALPHGASQKVVPALLGAGPKIVDLAADFRLRDVALYHQWYGETHTAPELIEQFAYGIPELNRAAIVSARAVAAAGCYPTAAALALAPLVHAGVVEPVGIIVDAASGLSGAGRALKHSSHFGTVNENFVAYGLLDHRHTPEIEQAIGAEVLFTPHLAPMTRGILATCYARPKTNTSTSQLIDALSRDYAGEPFITVSGQSPSTKATWGSNCAHLTARYDERTGWVIAISALDNLVKGASGQALQCANLMLGIDEAAGLSPVGIYP